MRATLIAACLFAFACSSKSTAKPDAAVDASKIDAFGLGFGEDCTTVSDMSTECASGVCTNSFNMFPTPVCSVKCTVLGGTDPVCPNGSMGMKCNMKGYCRP